MTGRTRLIAAAVGAVLVAFIGLLVFADTGTDGQAASPLVGNPAPAIAATDTEGRPFDLAAYRGQWVLVNFFASWCTPCQLEHPELVAFSEAHRAAGDASVVSVAYQDSIEEIEKFFAERGGDWAVVADGSDTYALEYGVVRLPESYLVDPDGVIVHKFVGGVTAAAVESEIDERSAA